MVKHNDYMKMSSFESQGRTTVQVQEVSNQSFQNTGTSKMSNSMAFCMVHQMKKINHQIHARGEWDWKSKTQDLGYTHLILNYLAHILVFFPPWWYFVAHFNALPPPIPTTPDIPTTGIVLNKLRGFIWSLEQCLAILLCLLTMPVRHKEVIQ